MRDDEALVADVLLTERWARDTGQWDVMARCFHDHSPSVEISGSSRHGPAFVELSRQGFEAGARSAHVVIPPLVRLFDHLAPGRLGVDLRIDDELYDSFRPSYATLSRWVVPSRDKDAVRDDLPGLDRPETVTSAYADARAWPEGR